MLRQRPRARAAARPVPQRVPRRRVSAARRTRRSHRTRAAALARTAFGTEPDVRSSATCSMASGPRADARRPPPQVVGDANAIQTRAVRPRDRTPAVSTENLPARCCRRRPRLARTHRQSAGVWAAPPSTETECTSPAPGVRRGHDGAHNTNDDLAHLFAPSDRRPRGSPGLVHGRHHRMWWWWRRQRRGRRRRHQPGGRRRRGRLALSRAGFSGACERTRQRSSTAS